MTDCSRTSLLGLPAELRLKIYDHLLDFNTGRLATYDPSCLDGHEWRFSYDDMFKEVSFGTRVLRHTATLPRISWLSLLSTCSTTHNELKEHMNCSFPTTATQALADRMTLANLNTTLAHKAPPGLRQTYELGILVKGVNIASLSLLSMPCAPQHCKQLTAHITCSGHVSFRGCGGPTPVVRGLYQTLNRFLHGGPMLDASTAMCTGSDGVVKLEVLKVVVRMDPASDVINDGHVSTNPEGPSDLICDFLEMLEETGLLAGFVNKIIVAVDDGGESIGKTFKEILVQQRENPKVPTLWEGYGFVWGPEAFEDQTGDYM